MTMSETQRAPLAPAVNDGAAIAALVMGVVGLTVLPVIGGVLALILGIASARIARAAGRRRSVLGTIGTWLGFIGLIISAVVIITVVIAATSHPTVTQQYINCLNSGAPNCVQGT